MKLDRALQLKVLKMLADIYPDRSYHIAVDMGIFREINGIDPALLANVYYLAQHGLIEGGYIESGTIGGDRFHENGTAITAEGLDFLAADGGIGAILNTVTVKIDAKQWSELLASKVESLSSITHEDRSQLAKAIRSLPAKAIEKVSEKMLEWAVDHAQDALPLLRTLIGLGAA